MNTVLRSFNVVKDDKILAHFELFKNGYRNEIRTATEVIYTGAYADQRYEETLNTNKLLARAMGARIVEN